MAKHVIGAGSLTEARVASGACSCGESWLQEFARPTGEPVAVRLVGIKAAAHLRSLPCYDADDEIGYDEHDFSEWTERPANMPPGRVRRLRCCSRCNLYETDPPRKATR